MANQIHASMYMYEWPTDLETFVFCSARQPLSPLQGLLVGGAFPLMGCPGALSPQAVVVVVLQQPSAVDQLKVMDLT